MKAIVFLLFAALVVAIPHPAAAWTVIPVRAFLCTENTQTCSAIDLNERISVIDLARSCEMRGYTFWCFLPKHNQNEYSPLVLKALLEK